MKKHQINFIPGSVILMAIILCLPATISAQGNEFPGYDRENLIEAAREIMEASRYCALVTLDAGGHPQARMMDPFLPGEDMVVWMGTNKKSRKVNELHHDPRVTLYYQVPEASGYLVIRGTAEILDDPEMKNRYWKEEWESFYPDKESTFTLIRVSPKKLEIVDYTSGIVGSSETWAVPLIEF